METLTQKHSNSSYGNKPNAEENRSTTHWAKRKIVTNDDLNKLQSLIVSGNVDLKNETQCEISNCECQGACMSNCVNSCEAACRNDCENGCRAACMTSCVNNLS